MDTNQPEQDKEEEGPEIVTTELGKRLFQDRLAEMRRISPNLKEPRWVIREGKPS